MVIPFSAPKWRAVGLGVIGLVALAGCNLGVNPVTYELRNAEDFNAPLDATGMASGDVDGDGDVDVVASGAGSIAVLTNDGSGAFTIDFTDNLRVPTSSPALADVDGDDDLDVVALVRSLSGQGDIPSVRRNDGSGGFGPIEPVLPDPPPGALTDLVAEDADGDGDVDLLAAARVGVDRHVGVYLNDGSGAFGAPATHSLAYTSNVATPARLVAGDLDGDDDIDVVATDVGDFTTPWGEVVDGTVAMVGLNDGTGTFAAAGSPIEVSFPGDFFALEPTLADVDDDGSLDLAVGGATFTTLPGDGAGGFGPPVRSDFMRPTADQVVPADIDGDGNLDLVGLESDPATGVVGYGDGTGSVEEVHAVGSGAGARATGSIGRGVEIADFDGDGDPDIVFLGRTLGYLQNAEGRPDH